MAAVTYIHKVLFDRGRGKPLATVSLRKSCFVRRSRRSRAEGSPRPVGPVPRLPLIVTALFLFPITFAEQLSSLQVVAPENRCTEYSRDLYPYSLRTSGLKGRIALVEAGDWNNPGGGNTADWNPRRLGANPPTSLVELQRLATEEIYMACGVPPGLFSARNNAGSREAYRQFIHATIAPLGRLVADELQRKLEVPVTITWEELRSADIAGRARAFQSLVGAGMAVDRAAALAGLLMPEQEEQ